MRRILLVGIWLVVISIPGYLLSEVLQDIIHRYLGDSMILIAIVAIVLILFISYVLTDPRLRRMFPF